MSRRESRDRATGRRPVRGRRHRGPRHGAARRSRASPRAWRSGGFARASCARRPCDAATRCDSTTASTASGASTGTSTAAPRSQGPPIASRSPARCAASDERELHGAPRRPRPRRPLRWRPIAGVPSPRATTATGHSCTPSAPTSSATAASGNRVNSACGDARGVGGRQQLGHHRACVPIHMAEAALAVAPAGAPGDAGDDERGRSSARWGSDLHQRVFLRVVPVDAGRQVDCLRAPRRTARAGSDRPRTRRRGTAMSRTAATVVRTTPAERYSSRASCGRSRSVGVTSARTGKHREGRGGGRRQVARERRAVGSDLRDTACRTRGADRCRCTTKSCTRRGSSIGSSQSWPGSVGRQPVQRLRRGLHVGSLSHRSPRLHAFDLTRRLASPTHDREAFAWTPCPSPGWKTAPPRTGR